jgi:hypothetical protein
MAEHDDKRIIENKLAREKAEELYGFFDEISASLPSDSARIRFYETIGQRALDFMLRFRAKSSVATALAEHGPMSIEQVREFRRGYMPFGEFEGQQLSEVPLRYLDWLVGENESEKFKALTARYLANEQVQEQLALEGPRFPRTS